MRSFFATAAGALAALFVAAGAAPAHAQHPGENGAIAVINQVNLGAPCFTGMYSDGPAPFDAISNGGMAFSADGQYLAVNARSMSAGTGMRLLVVHLPTCTARDLGPAPDGADMSWSPDGTRLAAERDGRIAVLDPRTGALLSTLAVGQNPTWHPNGGHLAYETVDGVVVAPARQRVRTDGRTPGARLLVPGAREPDYSPDGRRIAYIGQGGLAHASARTGRDEVRLHDAIVATQVRWSPDGQFFLYAGAYVPDPKEPSFRSDAHVITVDGQFVKTVCSDEPCVSPEWQPLPTKRR